MAPTTATTTSANPTLTATPAHEAARACLDGLQALPRRPPVALAGPPAPRYRSGAPLAAWPTPRAGERGAEERRRNVLWTSTFHDRSVAASRATQGTRRGPSPHAPGVSYRRLGPRARREGSMRDEELSPVRASQFRV